MDKTISSKEHNHAEEADFTLNEELEKEIIRRKQTEGELIRQGEFSRALLESMADGVVACDAEGMLILFNRTAKEWHGTDPMRLPPEEWAKYYDLFRSDGTTPLPTEEIPLTRAFKGEIVVDAGMAIVAKGQDPRFILANGSVIRDESGKNLGAVVVMRDVTELRRVEEALRKTNEELGSAVAARTFELEAALERLKAELEERKRVEDALMKSEQRLQLHVRQTPLAVIEWDTDFQVINWNPAAEKVFGYSAAEALGHHAEFIVPVSAKPYVDKVWSDLLVRNGGERSTNENVTKDGKTILCEWYNTPLVTADGNVVGVASLVQDITERKRTEEQLHKLNEELEQRIKERTTELEKKNAELERANRLFVGRELRMVELKERIRHLEEKTAERTT